MRVPEAKLMKIEGELKDIRKAFSVEEVANHPLHILQVYNGGNGEPGAGLWSDGRIAWMENTIKWLIAQIRN